MKKKGCHPRTYIANLDNEHHDRIIASVYVGEGVCQSLPFVRRHTTSEFALGNHNEGLLDLARSILIHHFRQFRKTWKEAIQLAEPLYVEFQRDLLKPKQDRWSISMQTIDGWLASKVEIRIAMVG